VKLMELQRLLIPGLKLQHIGGKYERYFVYVPKDFEKYLGKNVYIVTAVIDGREIALGPRKISRKGNKFIIALPPNLKYIWDKYLYQKIDIILESNV